jgi:putative ABC transport system substrate-binding protein
LRDLGYVEGKTIVVEFRSAEGKLERFPALVSELIALNVDVIVAANTQAALAAKQATQTIPIVFAGPFDPVTSGLVTNLAQPGGNVTGLSSSVGPELIGKNLELLKQAVPGVTRVAALWHRDYPERTQKAILGEAEAAARPLGVRLQFVEAGDPETFDRAFLEMARKRAEALTVLTSVLIVSSRRRLVDMPPGAQRSCPRRPEAGCGRGRRAIVSPRARRAGCRGPHSSAACSQSTCSCVRAGPARAGSWPP